MIRVLVRKTEAAYVAYALCVDAPDHLDDADAKRFAMRVIYLGLPFDVLGPPEVLVPVHGMEPEYEVVEVERDAPW